MHEVAGDLDPVADERSPSCSCDFFPTSSPSRSWGILCMSATIGAHMCASLRVGPSRPLALDAAAPIARPSPIPDRQPRCTCVACGRGGARPCAQDASSMCTGCASRAARTATSGSRSAERRSRPCSQFGPAEHAAGSRQAGRAAAIVGARGRRPQRAVRARRDALARVREAPRGRVSGRLCKNLMCHVCGTSV